MQVHLVEIYTEEDRHLEDSAQTLCEEHPEYSELIQVSYKILKHSSMSPETIQRKIKHQIHKWGQGYSYTVPE